MVKNARLRLILGSIVKLRKYITDWGPVNRHVTSLGHQGGEEFSEGAQIF